MTTHRLLVVDDNEDNRDMLARRLRKRGFDVDTAEDGFVALDRAESDHFDLIILDIMMPGMSGLEVLRRLREIYPRAELPILMATAKSGSDDMVKALELGANDYVTKPIDFPVVLARIQAHLQTRLQAPSLGPPAAPIPDDGRVETGTLIDGRYRVEETIGEGGFAIVYRAIQISTGRDVALKILRSQRAKIDGVDAKRFEREMKLIGKLSHPSVVRLIDFGRLKARVRETHTGWTETTDPSGEISTEETSETRTHVKELPYIVMEYVQGETLSKLLKRESPLDVERAVEIVLPVLSAVAVAHESGVLHRDLKPPNIMVPHKSGEPSKVLDFGIAKSLDDDSQASVLTKGEGLLGTPEYIAPELIRENMDPKPGCDQYALGCILYECIVGKRPFKAGSFVELVQKITIGEFEKPSSLGLQLPEGFESVMLRAMDKNEKRRFSSCQTFGRALLPFASERVRGRWAPFFEVQTDPPPQPVSRPPVPDVVPKVDPKPPVEPEEPVTISAAPVNNPTAARVGLALIGAGVLMAIAALVALLAR